jgi:hypothetical protein
LVNETSGVGSTAEEVQKANSFESG